MGRKGSNTMKPQTLALILTPIICLAFWSSAQAVSPPPDGGYPGGNTAEGAQALFSRTSGQYNAALGFLSLRNLTTASLNTGKLRKSRR
jgi:hypothetical protein